VSLDEDIVVTGASGFLGSAVLRETAIRGREGIGVVRRINEKDSHGRLLVTDLLESPDALKRGIAESRAGILVHCAIPNRESFDAYPASADSLTERIDLNVIRGCAESGYIRRIVLVSSSSVYGPLTTSENAFQELRLPTPVTQYGRIKLAQEKRWTAAFGAALLIARVFNVTGPGEPSSMVAGSLAERIANSDSHTVLSIRNSQSVRDFSDVRDVASALIHISRLSSSTPRCFNVSSDVGTTVLELAELIRTASGRDIKIQPDYTGAESRSIGDSKLLRSRTGWRNKIPLEASVRAMWNSRVSLNSEGVDPSSR
jgi:GDP-4-dehydro-6-deoxy-D-mannose reductase